MDILVIKSITHTICVLWKSDGVPFVDIKTMVCCLLDHHGFVFNESIELDEHYENMKTADYFFYKLNIISPLLEEKVYPLLEYCIKHKTKP